MKTKQIVAAIDAEISKLKQVRSLLAGIHLVSTPTGARAKRQITPEGRARIVAAQKRRWAARRKPVAVVKRKAA
jgi:hypothetical protein